MLLVRRGAAARSRRQANGLAAITADMLDEGSGDRSAIEMHEAIARLGAQFDTDIGSDATRASSVTVLSRFADRALGLLVRHRRPARAARSTTSSACGSCGCTA